MVILATVMLTALFMTITVGKRMTLIAKDILLVKIR